MCVPGGVGIEAHLQIALIPQPSCFVTNAAALALDRKGLRHLLARGPRLSGGKLARASHVLPPRPAPQEPRSHLLGHVAGVRAQEGEALKPRPQVRLSTLSSSWGETQRAAACS